MDPVTADLATTIGAAAVAATATIEPGLASYLLVVLGGFVGCLHSVSKVETPTRLHAARFIGTWTLTACVLTFAVAALLESIFGFPAGRWPGVVAFALTFFADLWPRKVRELISAWFDRRSGEPR